MIRYVFTGEEERNDLGYFIIPRDVTHVSMHESVTVIPAYLFNEHPNIVEFICHDGVERIEAYAFNECPSLRRVIIRGVKVVENFAFYNCEELEYVECPKLERIEGSAFRCCKCLSNIDLPSAKIVQRTAFCRCDALTDAKFGKELQSIEEGAFFHCPSLERITIPLKDGLITNDDTFLLCANLKHVDLVEGAVLHETVAALLLEEWRDDMNAAIDSINQILPNAPAGECNDDYDEGDKAVVIREWIARVLSKIISYKAQHCRILRAASSALQLVLPNDIVTNYVVPFLELPLHMFDGEDKEEEDEEENIDDSDGGNEFVFEEYEDGEEEKDGDNQDEVHSASADGEDGEEQQQQDNEGGRKRRKMANDDDTERVE